MTTKAQPKLWPASGLIAAAAFVSGAAVAGGPQWYVDVAPGISMASSRPDRTTTDTTLSASGFSGISSTESGSSLAVKFAGGRVLTERVHAEVSYIDFGEVYEYEASFNSGADRGTARRGWLAEAIGVSVVTHLRATRSAVYGKLGYHWVRTYFQSTTEIISSIDRARVSYLYHSEVGTAFSPSVGLGVSYDLSPQFAVRVEYDAFLKTPSNIGDGNDLRTVRLFTLGVKTFF